MKPDNHTAAEAFDLVERPEWASAVTARDLPTFRMHRWFYFPHSFSPLLVADLVTAWSLDEGAIVADPFVGAGTSVVAATQLGYSVRGWDLSPLAVLASRVKTTPPPPDALKAAWQTVRPILETARPVALDRHTELTRRAFPDDTLCELTRLVDAISQPGIPEGAHDALLLAVLAELPAFSRLVRKGGWLSNVSPARAASEIGNAVDARIQIMLADLAEQPIPRAWEKPIIVEADARQLPCAADAVHAVITSPPYPNRHDYTRVFGVELAFALLDADGLRHLRYQSVSSHPEAHPTRPDTSDYQQPADLTSALEVIQARITERRDLRRIPNMLAGYFLDLWLSLREVRRILVPGGRAAFVVGNAQYHGVTLVVDTILAQLALSAGLIVDQICVARRRGNSAQQMKTYGRQAQRESVVILSRPR